MKIKNVYRDLAALIQNGAYKPGEQLPSLRVMAKERQVSVSVVRHALERLRAEKRVEARHGKGFFVRVRGKHRCTLLLSYLGGDLWSEFIQHFITELNDIPYHDLMMEAFPGDLEASRRIESKIDSLLDNRKIDNILFIGMPFDSVQFMGKYIGRCRLVCFFNDGLLSDFSCASVLSDWVYGGGLGVRHLHDIGCREILVITHPLHGRNKNLEVFAYLRGVRQTARDLGMGLRELHHAAEEDDYIDRFKAVMRPEVDGIFGFGDFRLTPLLPVLQQMERKVGESIALLGYYDTPLATSVFPNISSINVKPLEIVRHCRKLLTEDSGEHDIVVQPEVAVRDSTARFCRNGVSHVS